MTRAGEWIDALFDSKLALGIVAVAVMVLGAWGVVVWQRPADTPAPAQARAGSWSDPIGPGLLSAGPRDLPSLPMQDLRDAKIAVDPSGHLVPDAALRSLMDEFLLKPAPADRLPMQKQLRELLRQRLAQPAAGEADRLASAYAAYLQAEGEMLARERFTRANADGLSDEQVRHLLAWQRERAALRERMLGTDVAAAWYAAQDANCTAVLDDWEKQLAPPADDDSQEQFNRRRFGAMLAERRNTGAQQCAAQLEDSLAPHG